MLVTNRNKYPAALFQTYDPVLQRVHAVKKRPFCSVCSICSIFHTTAVMRPRVSLTETPTWRSPDDNHTPLPPPPSPARPWWG